MNSYLNAMRRYASFRGRSTRSEFWLFSLMLLVLLIACSILDVMLGFDQEGALVITGIVYIAHWIPTLSVSVRRLHDIDRTGWWLLIGLVPLVGTVVLLVFACTASTAGANRFGPHPNADGHQPLAGRNPTPGAATPDTTWSA